MKFRVIKGIILKDLKELRGERCPLLDIHIPTHVDYPIWNNVWGGESPPITVDVGVVYTNESAPFTAYDIVEIMRNLTSSPPMVRG